jgi:hypothetical protein
MEQDYLSVQWLSQFVYSSMMGQLFTTKISSGETLVSILLLQLSLLALESMGKSHGGVPVFCLEFMLPW